MDRSMQQSNRQEMNLVSTSDRINDQDIKKADAFYNQGVLAKRNGNMDEAIVCYQKTLWYNPDDADACYNLGEALARKGRYADAHDMFAKAISLNPKDATAWCNLGFVMQELKKTGEACKCYQQAISIQPAYVLAYKNLGALYLAEREILRACNCFQEALEHIPGSPEIHFEMGNACGTAGEDERALAHYRKSVQLDANFGESHIGAALVHMRMNRIAEAIQSLRQAIRCEPGREKYWQTWANVLKWAPATSYPRLEADLVNCLAIDGIDKRNLSSVVPRFIFRLDSVAGLIARINESETSSINKSILSGELFAVLDCPLTNLFLKNVIATDPQWELLLVNLRSRILKMTLRGKIPEALQIKHLPLMCALASQCFLNEYVYHTSVGELTDAETMLGDIKAALDHLDDNIPVFKIALLAAYFPLFKTPLSAFADRIADVSDPLSELIDLQIRQPLQEQTLTAKIPCLTLISDDISANVRSQYEENPYPRWKDAGYRCATPLQLQLGDMFNHFDADLPEAPRVLVAGCGTGRHAINCAQGYLNAAITALDLSLPSLAYGKRKALALGLSNIDFVQGDLLNLKAIDGTYDLIESVGVLHHLDDPLQGWRVLTNHLNPGGVMKLGLYSGIARKHVKTVRQFIAQQGYEASTTGIKAFRDEVLNGGGGIINRLIKQSSDFYSMSACRDLFFHVKEHCFSLLQIKSILESLKLDFIGFEFDTPGIHANYRNQFPEDQTFTDLDKWHLFEQMHPELFAGMYQFWVRA